MENARRISRYGISRVLQDEAPEPEGLGASNLVQEAYVVKCDICGQELANSEEVKAHKEEAHPMGDVEKPEMGDGMDKPESEVPEPAEQRNR
jgi:hypothetical protein